MGAENKAGLVNKGWVGFLLQEKLGRTLPIFSATQGLTSSSRSVPAGCGGIGKSPFEEYRVRRMSLFDK
jgi:hypothetical protein